MFQDIFIIGATGNVGKELISQIFQNKDDDPIIHANPTLVVGVASSTEYLYNPRGLSKEEVISFSLKKLAGKKLNSVLDLLNIVPTHSQTVFVDVTAEKEIMFEFHKKVILNTSCLIATANKNPLVLCDVREFNELTSERSRYGYRCSVMAGAEAVNKMLDLNDLNDPPTHIEGCFSGTLGYLSSALENGENLSDSIKKARELGYTEPNPAVDLSGEDVARKLLILVRSAGFAMNFSDIKISPFVSKTILNSNSVEELLKNAKKEDKKTSELFSIAKKEGFTYRYVGSFNAEKKLAVVELQKVPLLSPLGLLKGTSNKIVILTKTFTSEKPYIVESPGAGLAITAQNIRRDLLYLLENRRTVSKYYGRKGI